MAFLLFIFVILAFNRGLANYDDFFHTPSSDNPLGGLKMPSLPGFSILKGRERSNVEFLQEEVSSRPWKGFGKSFREEEGGVTMQREASSLLPAFTEMVSSMKGVVGYAATFSLKVLGPVAIALVFMNQVPKLYKEKRAERQEEGEADASTKKSIGRILPNLLGSTTQSKLDKIQKDQEECWRVLHSVYKKHSALEEMMDQQVSKIEESKMALLSANAAKSNVDEQVQVKLGLIETRMVELDAAMNSMQLSMDTQLSSHATKKELDEMVGLMKSFIEDLKVAIKSGSNGNV